MSMEEKAVVTEEVNVAETPADTKAAKAAKGGKKNANKKENFFKRIWKKLVKLCKDTVGEMKKVVWTPKNELSKNTKLVIVTVVAIGLVIAVFDTACSYLINAFAGLIG